MNKTNSGTAETSVLRGELGVKKSALPDGKLTAHERMARLFDEGTFLETGSFIGQKKTEYDTGADDEYEPVVTGYGSVNGELVFAFSQDFSRNGGAVSEISLNKIVSLYEKAARSDSPVVGFFDSMGAKVLEGIGISAGYAKVMKCVSDVKYLCPQIAVISGACGGSTAVLAGMFDFVVTAKKSGSFYIAPSSILEDKTLGTPERLAKDGVSDITVADDAEAVSCARKLLGYFSDSETADDANRAVAIDSVLSAKEYNVQDVVEQICDAGSVTVLYKEHAQSMFCALARINSNVCGIVATDPSHSDGALCSGGAVKAAGFINLCSGFDIPVVTLVDACGLLSNDHTESRGLAMKLSSLAHAYACCTSPKITVVTGRAYGTVYTVLGSKSIGADMVFALDRAKIAAMNPDTAVEFLGIVNDESKHDEYAEEWARKAASPLDCAKLGYVDDIIASEETRMRIASALEMLTLGC